MSISAAHTRDCCSLDDFFTPSRLCRRATRQGIADWKLIAADERWGGDHGLPLPAVAGSYIGSINFLMPQKTHARLFPMARKGRKLRSNSSGGRSPSAECKRCWL